MALGIFLVIAGLLGVVYGIQNKNKIIVIFSVILLLLVIITWIYFYLNPY